MGLYMPSVQRAVGLWASVQEDILDYPKHRNIAMLQKLWERESCQTLIFPQHVADVFVAI